MIFVFMSLLLFFGTFFYQAFKLNEEAERDESCSPSEESEKQMISI